MDVCVLCRSASANQRTAGAKVRSRGCRRFCVDPRSPSALKYRASVWRVTGASRCGGWVAAKSWRPASQLLCRRCRTAQNIQVEWQAKITHSPGPTASSAHVESAEASNRAHDKQFRSASPDLAAHHYESAVLAGAGVWLSAAFAVLAAQEGASLLSIWKQCAECRPVRPPRPILPLKQGGCGAPGWPLTEEPAAPGEGQ